MSFFLLISRPPFRIFDYFKPPENWWQRRLLHVRVVIIHIYFSIATTSTKHVKIRHEFVLKNKKLAYKHVNFFMILKNTKNGQNSSIYLVRFFSYYIHLRKIFSLFSYLTYI